MTGPTLTHTQKARRLMLAGSVLLALLLMLVAWVWWTDNTTSRTLVSARTSTQSLRIERPDLPPIVLQKQTDEQWRIVEPCELPANPQRLQPLLESLTPAAHSYAVTEVDLEAAGLLTPEAILYLDEQALALGKTDLSGKRRYLQRGERVEFIAEWILPLINGGLSALAKPEVFPFGLDAIRLVSSSPEHTVAPNQDSDTFVHWQTLSAQQIVSWPLPENEAPISTQELRADTAGQSLALTLYDYQRFAAIRVENAACAYIISRASLPDSVFP